jgi:hypothetical protein
MAARSSAQYRSAFSHSVSPGPRRPVERSHEEADLIPDRALEAVAVVHLEVRASVAAQLAAPGEPERRLAGDQRVAVRDADQQRA